MRLLGDPASGVPFGLTFAVECSGTSPAGQYSTPLVAGLYAVNIPGTRTFEVQVGASGTHALEELLVDPGSGIGAYQSSFSTVADLEAVSLSDRIQFVGIRSDANGEPAWFMRWTDSVSGLNYGTDYVHDASSANFRRFVA